MSPVTIPWPSAPSVTAASPVSTPARALRSGASASAPSASTAETSSRGANGAFRVVFLGHRRAPDGHHCVADELLHHAAVALDHPAGCLEVARLQLADVLEVAALAERGVADEVGEQDRDEPPLGDRHIRRRPRRRRRRERRAALAAELGCRSVGRPHDGHARASAAPHSPQNFRPASFSVPQLEQITTT